MQRKDRRDENNERTGRSWHIEEVARRSYLGVIMSLDEDMATKKEPTSLHCAETLTFPSRTMSTMNRVLVSNGIHWHNIRKFTLRHLRDLGMGKSKIVSSVQREANELVKVMKKQSGKAAPVPHEISTAIINILWQMRNSRHDQHTRINWFGIMISSFKRLATTRYWGFVSLARFHPP
ncbi:hypothetical protein Avbf_05235 [Armadillidium vulgare]|nr:hypothetical protein Avbf_05235 [Armadillidium vulgare]